jgi:hypothetical protein
LVCLNHFGLPPFKLVVNCARLRAPIDPAIPIAPGHSGDTDSGGTSAPAIGHNTEQPPHDEMQEDDEASVASTITRDSTCANNKEDDLGTGDNNDLRLLQEQQELLRSLVDKVEQESQEEGMECVGRRLVVVKNTLGVDEEFTQGQIATVGDGLEDQIKKRI